MPALFAKGFRPFFLLAALFAALLVPMWLLTLSGRAAAGAYFGSMLWHGHEMVFGFAVAVLAGFLLTAVGNWTGRETAVGAPLAALCVLWLLGRFAVSFATVLPRGVPAAVDLAFLPVLAIVLVRPIIASKSWRNLVMIGVLTALWLANVAMHLDALGVVAGIGRRASLVAVDVVVFVIAVMAGRIFPMFTRNPTGVETIRNVPMLDHAALGALALLIVADAIAPEHTIAAWLAAAAAVLSAARAIHWGARHSWRIPLLWVLHLGYAWLPIGLALRAASGLGLEAIPPTLATHALTVGVIGLVTLGMMARVSLGHTGRSLASPRAATIAFVALALAAVVRVVGPFAVPSRYLDSVTIAGVLWSAGFLLYAASYARTLMSPRVDGKPG